MKLYGIPNCDTVKKARAFLDRRSISYTFHDFKKTGVSESQLRGWLGQVGWQKLLKKTGPTWAKLPDAAKAAIRDDDSSLALLLEQTNLIKRPVLERDGKVLALGFSESEYEQIFP